MPISSARSVWWAEVKSPFSMRCAELVNSVSGSSTARFVDSITAPSASTPSSPDAVTIVNRMLADAGAVPQLIRHDQWDWHLHAVGPERDLPTRIVVEAAMAMIDVIRADEMSRLGVCADDTCEGVVLDLSRNRSKRFCSTSCGNRNAVAAYRARQKES